MPELTARERLAAQGGSGGMDTLVIPPIPHVPPPTDPRLMKDWYSRFHTEMERWRERTNLVLQRTSGA